MAQVFGGIIGYLFVFSLVIYFFTHIIDAAVGLIFDVLYKLLKIKPSADEGEYYYDPLP
jgi:hypothetical protein